MAFPTTGILDDFNRADGDVGTNWTADILGAGYARPDIASNQCRADTGNAFSSAWWNVASFDADQEVYSTLPVIGSQRLYGRIQAPGTAGMDAYELSLSSGGSFVLRMINGTRTQIASLGVTPGAGDKWGMEITGTGATVTIRVYRDTGGGWAQIGSDISDTHADRIVSAGHIGLWFQNDSVGRFDDFGGGTLSSSTEHFGSSSLTVTFGASTSGEVPVVSTTPAFKLEVAFAHNPGEISYADTYADEVMADNPAGYWRLDDLTTTDGTAGDLTKFGTPPEAESLLTSYPTSIARELNGSSQHYTAADGAAVDFGDTFTLEAWVRPNTLGAQQIIYSKGANGYFLDINATGTLGLAKAEVAYIAQSTINLSADTTYHVVATKDGSTVKLYIDGVDRTGTVTDQTIVDTATDLHIGRWYTAASWWSGVLDELAVYPTALSAARVLAHFEAGSAVADEAEIVWTDISAYLMEFHVSRGRQKELDRIDSGTATFKLKNSDRRFDPTHDGPYNSGSDALLPLRRIRLRATYDAVTYDLFSGFVDSWPQSWVGPHAGFSVVNATDGFLPLAYVDVGEGETWPEELSGARINRILDAAGWPAGDRQIDDGRLVLPEVTIPIGSGVTALEQAKDAADYELGAFFLDGAGNAVFHDRHHRRAPEYLTAAGEFGDANTDGLPYRDVELDTDSSRIFNDVQLMSGGGQAARAEDASSRGKFFRRTMARSIQAAREVEGEDQAAYLLSLYKDPRYRLSKIEVVPNADPDLWAHALGREFGDHIKVNRHPQQVGAPISQECWIESIEHIGAPGITLVTSWMLSTPAYTEVTWWLLGDATYGELGVTTALVY